MTHRSASSAPLARLLRPRSIAVVGGNVAARVIAQCERIGYEGDIWPVHPSRDSVGGWPCYRGVEALPGIPDAAFIGVNRRSAIDVVAALRALGCGGAVVYAAGFAEAEDGASKGLQADLLGAAGAMPMLGPNCYGFINYADGALLWPDQHGGRRVDRGVAIVTQSSNIAINLTMQQRGLPIAYVVTVGNQAQRDVADVMEALVGDERVSAIGLYLEGIRDAGAFERAVGRARAREVPVVAVKAGRSEQARAVTLSHTASVAGADVAVGAFLQRLGVARLHTLPELLETLKLLHVHGPLSGRDICSISSSGGETALMADAVEGRDLSFRPLGEAASKRLRSALGEFADIANPLDFRTDVWGDEAVLTETFAATLGEHFDLALFVVDFPRADRCSDPGWPESIRAFETAMHESQANVAVMATLAENMPETWAQDLLGRGIVPLCGVEQGLTAVEAAAFIGRHWQHAWPAPVLHAPAGTFSKRVVIHEVEAKRRLAAYGLAVPAGLVCSSPQAAVEAADSLGYPVVVKATNLSHKTEANGVVLGLRDGASVHEAVSRISAASSPVLVERMSDDGIAELMVGVTRDPQFGLLLTLGAGGTQVEILGDTASVLLPTDEAAVRAALSRLRMAPMLRGFRQRPAGDVDAAVAAVQAVGRFAQAHLAELRELDINPLIVRPAGRGVVAVDALMVLEETSK